MPERKSSKAIPLPKFLLPVIVVEVLSLKEIEDLGLLLHVLRPVDLLAVARGFTHKPIAEVLVLLCDLSPSKSVP